MEPLSQDKLSRLKYFLKDDKYALLFCLDLLYVAHVWDDMIDLDKQLTGEDINQAFVKSLYNIPNNLFYIKWQTVLLPMMHNVMILWLESNELKKGTGDQRATAFTIMHSIVEIIHFCIVLTGGIDWARDNASEFWNLFGVSVRELEECMEGSDAIQ